MHTYLRLIPSQDDLPLAQHSNGEAAKASERPHAPKAHILSSRHDSPAAIFSSRHTLSIPQMPEAQSPFSPLHAAPAERPVHTYLRLIPSQDDLPLAQHSNGAAVKASERPHFPPSPQSLSCVHDEATTKATENIHSSAKIAPELVGLSIIISTTRREETVWGDNVAFQIKLLRNSILALNFNYSFILQQEVFSAKSSTTHYS